MSIAMRKISTLDLTLSREIPAPPAEVYAVWLDDKSPGSPWFGVDRVIIDAKPDGLFYHSVQHEGRSWAHYGRFIRLEIGKVIEHTWMSEATQGLETTVTVTLEPKGDGTLLTLRHQGVPEDKLGPSHKDGWGFLLNAIAQRFAKRAA